MNLDDKIVDDHIVVDVIEHAHAQQIVTRLREQVLVRWHIVTDDVVRLPATKEREARADELKKNIANELGLLKKLRIKVKPKNRSSVFRPNEQIFNRFLSASWVYLHRPILLSTLLRSLALTTSTESECERSADVEILPISSR